MNESVATEPSRRNGKSAAAFRTISEVATDLDVPSHVLRFWETRFVQVRPLKRGGGRRYYRPEDVELLRQIRRLLYEDGYTIKGVQKLLRDGGLRAGTAYPGPAGAGPAGETLSVSQRRALTELLDDLQDLRGMLRGG